jgi:hypothetical protein
MTCLWCCNPKPARALCLYCMAHNDKYRKAAKRAGK